MSDVAAHICDRTNRETSKHYRSLFKHHLYSATLTNQDKEWIYSFLQKLQKGRSAPEIDKDSGYSSVNSRKSSEDDSSFAPGDSFGLYDDIQSPLEEWSQDESSML